MPLPPLPPGFSLQGGTPPQRDPNLLKPLLDAGIEATNGYRAPGDTQRLRAQGYHPATDSGHLNGDKVDLVPGRSGLTMREVEARANQLASRWPGARVRNEGSHIDVSFPGWGMAPGTPGTPNFGLPPLPPGARLQQRGALTQGGTAPQPSKPSTLAQFATSTALTPTGRVHDGDTLRLSDGRNGRLFGYDAFELAQQGRRRDGSLVPLGIQARDFLRSHVSPSTPVNPTGGETYGRPVVTLGDLQNDPARRALRLGLGLAEPNYLRGSPQLGPYMEAERRARLNLLGGHGTNAETPSQFRHKDGPWKGAEPGVYGQNAEAIFPDEPTPFQGLRDDIAEGYLAVWQDPSSTPEDMLAFAKENGFDLSPSDVRKRYHRRNQFLKAHKPGELGTAITYEQMPRLLTNAGDGAAGAALRGFADPFNMLDEFGALADSVSPLPDFDGPRENIWNSDRRFGDILYNNLGQNRAILDYDDEAHPYARLGGQIGSAVATPAFGIQGVAARAAEKALAAGASRFAAEEIGRRALVRRMAALGAGEGAAAGFGAGEGGPVERLPNTALGAVAGGTLGGSLGLAGEHFVPLAARSLDTGPGRVLKDLVADESSGAVGGDARIGLKRLRDYNAGLEGGRGTDALTPDIAAPQFRIVPNGGRTLANLPPEMRRAGPSPWGGEPVERAAMAADRGPSISGPVPNEGELPPLPEGFALHEPFGGARPMNERLSPEDMARLAEGVDPASVLPRKSSSVESFDEALEASPGRFQELEAPDQFDALRVRKIPSRTDFYKFTRVRGPLDITQRLRTYGGIQDQGGELAHLGITNEPRRLPFGGGEQFLGKLIDNERGLPLDEATHRLWEEGYLPEFQDRPTPADLLDKLRAENTGAQRYFHPDDLEEVAGFDAAQAQRYAVDEAKARGAPLAEDRTHEINLDDLVAQTPPVSAYEEAPRLTGKIGNINLDRIERPEQVGQLIDQVSKRVGGFSAAARGRITNDETRKLAEEMGVKPEQLLQRRQGQALNAEQLYAARAVVQRSRETVVRLANKAVGGSVEDLLTFRKAWLKHAALEEELAGASAEAGRALQQFKMLASGRDANGEAVRAYLRGGGGRDNIEDAARAIVDLSEHPAQASRFIRESVKPRWRDKFNELWVNSLLSGPRTHVVNFVGNAVTTLASIPEQAMTVAVGKVTRSTDRATMNEVAARVGGMANGAVEGLSRMKRAWKTGEALDASSKVEAAHHQAIGGRAGAIVRIPTRALTAADEFWKGINSSMELHQIAWRKALQEGGDKAAIQSRYEALLRSPTDDMVKQAEASARYYTFQKELGPVGRAVSQISNNSVVGKILLPFVRTPINLLKFAGERSAFALAMPEVRAAIRAGGRQRDEAIARITLGSGLSTAAVMAALDGRVSGGGPTDPRERAALLQSGWQPYSIRMGDKWVSYSRFDPFSTLIGVAADFAEAGKWATEGEADQVALGLTKAIAKNITNKTWLSGLSDAFDVLSDPDRYGKGYVQRLAASAAVPALASQTAQAIDPDLRDARSIMDAIKARVPVLSQTVPVRRNVWGEPVTGGDAIGPDILSPFYASKVSGDPVNQEVARLRASISMPKRYITIGGKRVDLTAEQFDAYSQLSGQPAKQALAQEMRSPEWRSMTDAERRQFIKETLSDFRATAREELAKRYPELRGAEDSDEPAATPRGLTLGDLQQQRRQLPQLPPGFVLQARP